MRSFIFFSVVCCLLTALSTIVIHSFPHVEMSFEERIMLYKSSTYISQKLVIIVHCLLVIVSMLGFAIIKKQSSFPIVKLGFLFYVIFAVTEIVRQVLCLFYLNGLRKQYVTSNLAEKEILKISIDNFNHINFSLYTIFIIAFGIATLCYGLSLIKTKKLIIDRWLGTLLMLWSLGTFIAFINVFIQNSGVSIFVNVLNNYFQPTIRIVLAIWLFKKYREFIGARKFVI